MKYIDVQIKVMEKLRENHAAVIADWKVSHDPALESTLMDINSTIDMMNEVFNELIEEEQGI